MVHRIREWMEEKLQTYFKGDTECLNRNIWMISCTLIWCCFCWFLVFLVLFVCFFFNGFYRTWYFSYFCSGCMCTSRFNIFTCWTSLTKGNERRSTLSRVYNCVIYLFFLVIKERKFVTEKVCSSRIGWTVPRPPMTYQDIHNILVFQVWNNDEMLERRTQLKTIFWEVEKQTQRDGKSA